MKKKIILLTILLFSLLSCNNEAENNNINSKSSNIGKNIGTSEIESIDNNGDSFKDNSQTSNGGIEVFGKSEKEY